MDAVGSGPGLAPRPNAVAGVAGFAAALRALKVHVGNPSLKELAKRSGIPRSTLADALNPARSRVPRLSVVTAFVEACGVTPREALRWRQAWQAVQSSQDRLRAGRLDAAAAADSGRRPREGRAVRRRAAAAAGAAAGSAGRPPQLTLVMADLEGGMVVCTIDGMAGVEDTPAREALSTLLRALGLPTPS